VFLGPFAERTSINLPSPLASRTKKSGTWSRCPCVSRGHSSASGCAAMALMSGALSAELPLDPLRTICRETTSEVRQVPPALLRNCRRSEDRQKDWDYRQIYRDRTCPCSTDPSHREAVKCGATTRLSGRVSDRPTKLSQILEMGASLEARGSCHEGMSGHRPGTMPSSTLPALAAECDRRPKSVALEHNSTADNARPRHLGIAFLRDYPCWRGDCVLYAALGKTATYYR
jgi:hypothetical protein